MYRICIITITGNLFQSGFDNLKTWLNESTEQ